MFEQLKFAELIQESCSYGRNLTFFALEDSTKMSKVFNGNLKGQQDSVSKPGIIRMAVESVFAHIFSSVKQSQFVLKL